MDEPTIGKRSSALPGHSLETIVAEADLKQRVEQLGQEITADYANKEPVVICVLKGACLFTSDLARAIDLPMTMEFIRVSSYGNNIVSTGEVKMELDVANSIANRHVILVEDIVDTGLTLQYLKANLQTRQPASMRVCSLLHKPGSNVKISNIEYVGFNIPNDFVVGYGLDYQGYYRNLPYIARIVDLK